MHRFPVHAPQPYAMATYGLPACMRIPRRNMIIHHSTRKSLHLCISYYVLLLYCMRHVLGGVQPKPRKGTGTCQEPCGSARLLGACLGVREHGVCESTYLSCTRNLSHRGMLCVTSRRRFTQSRAATLARMGFPTECHTAQLGIATV